MHLATHRDDGGQHDRSARHQELTSRRDVPRTSSASLYQDESGILTSDVTLASPSYGLSSRRDGQPNNFQAAQNIQQNPLRHSVHSPTPPIDHPSVVYDGDVTTERAYNTQRNYRASAGNYNSTVMDTLTTDIAQMGTRFSIQGPSNLEGDMLESHDYQPASPRQQHQHNHFSASGYSPPALTLSGNFGVHQFDSSRMLYSPMPGLGSGHTETHVTSEQSSPSLGTLRNRKAYSIRGESGGGNETPLDRSYQVQKSPSEFFIVGRVFSILWHEGRGQQGTVISDFHSQGRSTQSQFFRGRFGEEIFSGIRRMVVVKAMSQCAWCVPITTYGGQGVAKPGVDPAKHAIVYMRGSVPTCKPDEPRMTKEPLEINPARPDERLDEMSRLNFGKVYTVEHNVKVRHVGMISSTSMVKFRGYASNEFRLDI
ncbi:hypothetical protein KXV68_004133 [Aspergillus fumigatus]|nr:hypothetical protein KXX67_000175 [Aspergillus fumigatus]KAH2156361.1 hypothetical protein KXV68_004133 [Aspergillus fumigatus]KAH2355819.1 hypothetical protein KXW91_006788 [Aspergillus fumigatus]KAH2829473.1 hypothetical protein KXW76_007771 [Aspergillus fumigatus]KAH3299830.1 hypothetical protein KXW74_006137 [Aspergillus fumigatus]